MVAAGQDHPFFAAGHDGGKRVEALCRDAPGCTPRAGARGGLDLGIDVQPQSQPVKIGDLARGEGRRGLGMAPAAVETGASARASDAGMPTTSRTKICIALPGLPAAMPPSPAGSAPPGEEQVRDRGLEEHRAGEHGGCGQQSLKRHHRPRGNARRSG